MQHKRTGKVGTATEYPIDNSAFIHLAVHNKWHSNVFRLECHLKMQFVRHDCSRQRMLWQSVSRCLRPGFKSVEMALWSYPARRI